MLDMERGPVPVCGSCSQTKNIRAAVPREAHTRASRPVYRIFADLSGRKPASLSGYRYYLILIDDYSRKRWVYHLRYKSETLSRIKNFVLMMERMNPDFKVAQFRTDGGGEFCSIGSN